MIDKKIAIRYSKALFLLAETRSLDLEILMNQLKNITLIITNIPELRSFLTAPIVPNKKKTVVLKTLTLGTQPALRHFLFYLLNRNRFSLIEAISEEFEKRVNEKIGRVTGSVTSARNLTETERRKITEAFEEKLNKKIEFEFTVDGSLMGGIIATLEDVIYDGSLKNYLAKLDMRLSKLVLR